MRYIVYTLLAVGLAFGLLQVAELDPDNYVKIYLAGYAIEMNVIGFIVASLLFVLVLYVLLRLLRSVISAPGRFGKWRKRRKIIIADNDLGSGYLSLIKGDWRAAEKRLTAHADNSPIPYVSYLAAAQAAQEQGKLAERDDYLSRAYKAAPKETLAIGLTKARLHQVAGQWNMARATLEDIQSLGKNNPQYTAMLMQVHQRSKNWQDAKTLLPNARKQEALSAQALDDIEDQVLAASLDEAIDMDAAWKALPRAQRKKNAVITRYSTFLIEQDRSDEAEKILKASMKTNWDDRYLELFSHLKTKAAGKTRRTAEGWLLAQPENPYANLAAGRQAMLEGDNELAKKYLHAAISFGQLPDAYRWLGELFENLEERNKALQLFKSGLLANDPKNLAQSKAALSGPKVSS